MTQLSVIVPTYNEAPNVAPLVEVLTATLRAIDYEIIIVDDDSPDQTWRHAEEISTRNSRVRVIRRTSHPGLAAAVIEGFEQAKGQVVACMDGDLQHDPAILPAMLVELERGFSLVVASRYTPEGSTGDWSIVRRLQSFVATKLAQWLLGVKLHDPMSGFFMMRRADFLNLRQRLHAQGFKILLEIVARLQEKRIAEVPYRFRPRTAGASKLSSRVVLSYMAQLARLSRTAGPPRFVKFGMVGSVGAVVNLASMAGIISRLGWTDWRASALATFIATINNYLLNNAWTFNDRLRNGHRLLRGYVLFLASSLVGVFVTTITYTGITAVLAHQGVPLSVATLLIAQATAILCGFYLNYSFSRRVTWPTPQQQSVGPTKVGKAM